MQRESFQSFVYDIKQTEETIPVCLSGAKGKKQMTLPFKPVKKEKRNPWSDSSEPELSDSEAAPRERVPRRAAGEEGRGGLKTQRQPFLYQAIQ